MLSSRDKYRRAIRRHRIKTGMQAGEVVVLTCVREWALASSSMLSSQAGGILERCQLDGFYTSSLQQETRPGAICGVTAWEPAGPWLFLDFQHIA